MKILKKIFSVPEDYIKSVEAYKSMDAIRAIGVFAAVFVLYALCGVVALKTDVAGQRWVGILFNGICIGIVLILMRHQKEGLETVGLKGGNIKLTLIIGCAVGTLLFFLNGLSNIWFAGKSFVSADRILIDILFYLFVALSEELIFRGYILTRLYGLVKSVYVDMLIAALLFVLMHFPYRMAAYQMSFVEFITNVDRVSDLFITGLWLSYIRIKTNSLYGAILPHWMSDLAYDIVTHV